MLSRLTGFISPYIWPIVGVAALGMVATIYVLGLKLDRAKSDLAAKENVITALSAENKNFADLVARQSAKHAAELAALKSLQPRIIERVRVVERAKQEVKHVAKGDITVCAPGVSSVVERVREYEAERSISAGGGRKEATARIIDVSGDTGSAGSD